MKAIVLFSGGLDSLLTSCLLQEQGIEVVGLNVVTPFHDCSEEAQLRANELGIKLIVHRFGEDYMHLLSHAKWGYGKGYNPCIDCRIAMCRVAATLMREENADFVATGEIAGQRPNSQKIHQLNLIDRESGLDGRLVRPLCAKVLLPTLPEKEGWINRENMRSFTGRMRGRLIGIARKRYNLPVIPQPSTGCLLCEKSFAPRVRDLIRFKPDATCWDAATLDAGRQIRINEHLKCVVGRRRSDCELLETLFKRPDRSPSVLLLPANFQGAAVLAVSDFAPSVQHQGIYDPNGPVDPSPNAPNAPLNAFRDIVDKAAALSFHFTNPVKYSSVAEPLSFDLFYGQERGLAQRVPNEGTLPHFVMIEDRESSPRPKTNPPNLDDETGTVS